MTNRHVACPWLEDQRLFATIGQLRAAGQEPHFDYRMFLWFEGDTAFNRLLGIGPEGEIEDIYDTLSAYSRGGNLEVKILQC